MSEPGIAEITTRFYYDSKNREVQFQVSFKRIPSSSLEYPAPRFLTSNTSSSRVNSCLTWAAIVPRGRDYQCLYSRKTAGPERILICTPDEVSPRISRSNETPLPRGFFKILSPFAREPVLLRRENEISHSISKFHSERKTAGKLLS